MICKCRKKNETEHIRFIFFSEIQNYKIPFLSEQFLHVTFCPLSPVTYIIDTSTNSQWAEIPAMRPPMVCEAMALEISWR